MKRREIAWSSLFAAAMLGSMTASAIADPILTIQKFIPIPADAANVQPGGAFTAFDISFFNPATGLDYVADRSNASVDIFSGSTLSFLGRATGFTGQQATTSVSGPDGVLAVTAAGSTTIYAGDGDSTLKVFNGTNPAAPSLLQSISTGSSPVTRVDEMAYSPLSHQVLAANNAATPAYGNLFNTTNGTSPVTLFKTPITIPGQPAAGGMEQPAWDPNTGTFFVSIPQLTASANDPGGLAEVSTSGTVLRTISLASLGVTSCAPAGLAVGASGNLMVGCSTVGAAGLVINPTGGALHTGSIVASIPGIGGTDELWYDPTTNSYYVTGNNGTNTGRFFNVVSDATDLVTQTVDLPITTSAHSIAVDSLNGDVFVPLAGSNAAGANSACALGCIAVYGVPEPDSLPLLVVGALALLGLAVQRHRRGA